MAIQVLNNNERGDVFREKLNSNFAELDSNIQGLSAEATAKWVLLNDVDNRTRANTNDIAELRSIVGAANTALETRLNGG